MTFKVGDFFRYQNSDNICEVIDIESNIIKFITIGNGERFVRWFQFNSDDYKSATPAFSHQALKQFNSDLKKLLQE